VLRSEQIAAHWWAAGDEAQALHATVAATATLRHAGLQADALALATQALQRVHDSAARARLRAVRSRIRLERAEPAEAEADALAALDEVAAPQDRAGAFLVTASCACSRPPRRRPPGAAASRRLRPGHEGLILEQARVAQLMGRVADVVDTLEQRCAQLRQLPPGHELLQVLISLGSAYGELGQVPRGLALLQEAYRLGARMNARYAQVGPPSTCSGACRRWAATTSGGGGRRGAGIGRIRQHADAAQQPGVVAARAGRIEQASRLCEQLVAGAIRRSR